MPTSLLSRVREKIIAKVPEIVALEPGCYVRQKYAVKYSVLVISDVCETEEGHKYVTTTHGHTEDRVYLERYHPSDNYIQEIIGRTIRLSDALRAHKEHWRIYALERGNVSLPEMQKRDSDFTRIVHVWNLSQDDLSLQSEECLQFLDSVLQDISSNA